MKNKLWDDMDYPASATFLGIDDGRKKRAYEKEDLSFSDKDLEDPVFLKNFLFVLEICLGIHIGETHPPEPSAPKDKKSPVVVRRPARGVTV